MELEELDLEDKFNYNKAHKGRSRKSRMQHGSRPLLVNSIQKQEKKLYFKATPIQRCSTFP